MKKKNLRKRILSIWLAAVMLLCAALSAGAAEEPPMPEGGVELTEDDFIVPEAAAAYIAEFFVEDMAESGHTRWNSGTKAVNTVVMYDETGLAPSAYAVELTEGYVVVSAYADVPSLVLEWADEGEPVYSGASLAAEEDLIYTSPLDYYVTDGETVETLQGEEVDAEEIPTPLQDCRSQENVAPALRETITEEKTAWLEDHPFAAYAGTDSHKGDYITDPFGYALCAYPQKGEWKCVDWKNYWENYTSNALRESQIPSYKNACVPISITNMIRLYGNRYSTRSANAIKSTSNTSIFKSLLDLKYWAGFYRPYYNQDGSGTIVDLADDFARDAFSKHNISATVGNMDTLYMSTVREALANSDTVVQIAMAERDLNPYTGNMGHTVLGYAYTLLWNEYEDEYITFVKILDGQYTGNRFIDGRLIVELGGSNCAVVKFE